MNHIEAAKEIIARLEPVDSWDLRFASEKIRDALIHIMHQITNRTQKAAIFGIKRVPKNWNGKGVQTIVVECGDETWRIRSKKNGDYKVF